jgi:hypothetical protein
MTLRPLQNWFDKMAPKERLILLGVAWVVVLLWLTLLTGQIKRVRADYTLRQLQLKTQQGSLDKRGTVEANIKKYQEIFKTTILSADLVNKVKGYADAAGLMNTTITSQRPDSKKESIFTINAVTLHFSKAPERNLADFCSKIEADQPYLIINELTMTPGTGNTPINNPRLKDGDIRISSLELKPGALDVSAQPLKH